MRKIDLIKRLFVRIASSYTINWLLLFVVGIGMIFNIWSITFYKVLSIFLLLEVLSVDINNVTYIIQNYNTDEEREDESD